MQGADMPGGRRPWAVIKPHRVGKAKESYAITLPKQFVESLKWGFEDVLAAFVNEQSDIVVRNLRFKPLVSGTETFTLEAGTRKRRRRSRPLSKKARKR
jgi:hypothetical protein